MILNRYLHAVLTLIALELLWIALNGLPVPTAAAAAANEPTPVVITGVRLGAAGEGILPVAVTGTVNIEARTPLQVAADEPLKVQAVPYTPSTRPGE
jgi:hypothetical protein